MHKIRITLTTAKDVEGLTKVCDDIVRAAKAKQARGGELQPDQAATFATEDAVREELAKLQVDTPGIFRSHSSRTGEGADE